MRPSDIIYNVRRKEVKQPRSHYGAQSGDEVGTLTKISKKFLKNLLTNPMEYDIIKILQREKTNFQNAPTALVWEKEVHYG